MNKLAFLFLCLAGEALGQGPPSEEPSNIPSVVPSDEPSTTRSEYPSTVPSEIPSDVPSFVPSFTPSDLPSEIPSVVPSVAPSDEPSLTKSDVPSETPSNTPSESPSVEPSMAGSELPSITASEEPSFTSSAIPSDEPSFSGSEAPSAAGGSEEPSYVPSEVPSDDPSMSGSESPSETPSFTLSEMPSTVPSEVPSISKDEVISASPSALPSEVPTAGSESPSETPSFTLTEMPSTVPSGVPSTSKDEVTSVSPSALPSEVPTAAMSISPSLSPTMLRTRAPIAPPSIVFLLFRGDQFFDFVEADGFTFELQDNGVLILSYAGSTVWQSDVEGDASLDYFVRLQGDCNLIVYEGTPEARGPSLWKTKTSSSERSCFLAVLPFEGKIRLSSGTVDAVVETLWEEDLLLVSSSAPQAPTLSPVGSPPLSTAVPIAAAPTFIPTVAPVATPSTIVLLTRGDQFFDAVDSFGYTLELEDDGVLILSLDGMPLWESNELGDPALDYFARLQNDCNFIVFEGTPESRGPALWKTRTSFHDMEACFLAVIPGEGKIRLSQGTVDAVVGTLWEEDLVV